MTGQERSEKAQHRLQKAVEFTTLLLADLIDSSLIGVDVAGRDVVRVAAMPKTAVYQSQGLAFISRRKKGCFLSACSEQVVLIWKKSLPDGTAAWSGPIFLKGKSWGTGLTIGFMNMRVCLAIMNSKGMSGVLRPHHNTGFNFSFFVDMNGSRMRPLHTSSAGASTLVQTDTQGGMMARYYLLEACIMDVSANYGYFGPDMKMNRAVYGEDVDVQEVLEGRVSAPPEFQPVYDLLNEYTRAVKREHRTIILAHDRSTRTSARTTDTVAEAVAGAKEARGGGLRKSSSKEEAPLAAAAAPPAPVRTEEVLAGAAAKLERRQLLPISIALAGS